MNDFPHYSSERSLKSGEYCFNAMARGISAELKSVADYLFPQVPEDLKLDAIAAKAYEYFTEHGGKQEDFYPQLKIRLGEMSPKDRSY